MEINAYAPDFELPDIHGEVVHLTPYLAKYRAVVVVFMCNHCPYVKAYIQRLIDLQAYFNQQHPGQVCLVGINANDQQKYPEDSLEKMQEYAKTWGLNFPYLRDRTQEVAEAFAATCTPEPFVLDSQGILRYRGQIDDNYRDPAAVTQPSLKLAIEQVLQGQPVTIGVESAVGCSIKWK
ncbi:MAG: thioredoxin family protein [Pseudanabaenaceae cyanobacterium bins.68]|nr:thioredoxin family protein [Pseudanabaenaceae cyanobacterium bins.68]